MTLMEKAYRSLRHGIICGDLAPGSPLRLNALSDRYGVGFSPLREALNRLHGERLVVQESLRGFRVAPLSLDAMWDTIRTRILIETEALRLSIDKGDDAWEAGIVATLHALTRQAKRASEGDSDYATLEDRHNAFHSALIAACGSAWLLTFSERLYLGSERYRFPALMARKSDGSRDIPKEHADLADAALDRKTERASALLDGHYRKTGVFIESVLGQRIEQDRTEGRANRKRQAS